MEQAGAKEGKEEGEKVPQIKKKKIKGGGQNEELSNADSLWVFRYS